MCVWECVFAMVGWDTGKLQHIWTQKPEPKAQADRNEQNPNNRRKHLEAEHNETTTEQCKNIGNASAFFTDLFQELAFDSQLPGGHFLCLLTLGLAGSESVGNVDPKFALLLRHRKRRRQKVRPEDVLLYCQRLTKTTTILSFLQA